MNKTTDSAKMKLSAVNSATAYTSVRCEPLKKGYK